MISKFLKPKGQQTISSSFLKSMENFRLGYSSKLWDLELSHNHCYLVKVFHDSSLHLFLTQM